MNRMVTWAASSATQVTRGGRATVANCCASCSRTRRSCARVSWLTSIATKSRTPHHVDRAEGREGFHVLAITRKPHRANVHGRTETARPDDHGDADRSDGFLIGAAARPRDARDANTN